MSRHQHSRRYVDVPGLPEPDPPELGPTEPDPPEPASPQRDKGASGQIWTATEGCDPFRVRGLAAIVASNIRFELARYDLTQEDLASILYRSRAAISRRINGSVPWSLEDVGMIAEAMGIRPRDFVERAHRPQVPQW